MADDGHLPQKNLPEWLQGHIHPYPGGDDLNVPDDELYGGAIGSYAADTGGTGDDAFSFDEGLANLDSLGAISWEEGGASEPAPEAPEDAEVIPLQPDLEETTDQAVVPSWMFDDDDADDADLPADTGEKGIVEEFMFDDAEPEPAADISISESGEISGLTGALPWLSGDDSPDAAQSAPSDEGDSSLDWMASSGEGFAEEEAAEPADEETIPDWLLAPSDEDAPSAEAAIEPPAPDEETIPEWMLGGDDDEPLAASDDAPSAEPAAVPDWLGDAEPVDEPTLEIGDLSAEFADAATPGADVPDWMAAAEDFGADDDEETEAPASESAPEWLGEEAVEAVAEDPDLTYEDWQEIQEEEEYQPSEEELLAEEVPDFFAAIGDAPEAPAASEGGTGDLGPEFVPDWYLGLEDEGSGQGADWFDNLDFSADALTAAPVLPTAPTPEPAAPEPPPAEAAGDDISDLMAELAAEAPPTVDGDDVVPGDVPDWFAEMAPTQDEVAEAAAPEATLAPAEGLPAGIIPPTEAAPAAASDLEAPDLQVGDMPDWFMAELASDEAPAPAPTEAATDASDGMDWLTTLSQTGALNAEKAQQAEELAAAPEAAVPADDSDFMDLINAQVGDDPLEALGLTGELGGGAVTTQQQAEFSLDDLLGDLSDMPVDAKPADPRDMEIPREALPGTGELVGYSVVAMAYKRGEINEEELSARLKALRRRTGKVASVKSPTAAETTGAADEILGGMSDVLTPTDISTAATGREALLDKAPDKAQMAQVATLAGLIGLSGLQEEEAQPVGEDGEPIPVDLAAKAEKLRKEERQARARLRFKPMRIVVTALLLVAVMLPFFVDVSSWIDLPDPALDPEVHGVIDVMLQELRPDDLLLVGFEYGPTTAGEMDTLAIPLLTHALLLEVRPIIVSTNPAGTLHAAELIGTLAEDEYLLAQLGRAADDPLTSPEDYVVLPYLPGGQVGLRAMTSTSIEANAFERGIFAVDYQGEETGLGALKVNDMPFALVLAERGEDVRSWVEQVSRPADVPLGAAVSVAAEPIVRPYFDAEMVVGLLAGYRDGYVYDQVLLAALPPAYEVVAAAPTRVPTEPPPTEVPPTLAPGEEVTPSATFTPSPTFTPAPRIGLLVVQGQGLITNTPAPLATATRENTAVPTATDIPPSDTPDPEATEPAEDAVTDAQPEESSTPTATERAFVTATAVEDGPQPTVELNHIAPKRNEQATRWYSTTLGAFMAAGIIALGALLNILQLLRGRQDQ